MGHFGDLDPIEVSDDKFNNIMAIANKVDPAEVDKCVAAMSAAIAQHNDSKQKLANILAIVTKLTDVGLTFAGKVV